jgi:hypothetical protein
VEPPLAAVFYGSAFKDTGNTDTFSFLFWCDKMRTIDCRNRKITRVLCKKGMTTSESIAHEKMYK